MGWSGEGRAELELIDKDSRRHCPPTGKGRIEGVDKRAEGQWLSHPSSDVQPPLPSPSTAWHSQQPPASCKVGWGELEAGEQDPGFRCPAFHTISHLFSLVAQMVKNLPEMHETQVWSLGREVPLEKGMATHSSIPAWRIPWTEEPGELQSTGWQRVGHDWVTNTSTFSSLYTHSSTTIKSKLKGTLGSEKPRSVGGKLWVSALMPPNVAAHFLAK